MKRKLRTPLWIGFPIGIAALVGGVLLLTGSEYPAGSSRHPAAELPNEFMVAPGTPESPAQRTVVLLLFDGLAPALLDGVETPSLDRLRREGSWTRHMVPPFPTISLISGFTISTGCWPEQHGIVTNRFFDPERGFYDHSRDADWVTGCEQLHQVAERQGVPTAALGWYGEVSAARGKLARIVEYTATWPYPSDAERAEQVVRLLRLPSDERPKLILAYFRGPDGAAHFRGMQAPETRAAVAEVDRVVGSVLDAIAAADLQDDATLIVTTDHGMVPVTHLINVEYLLRKHGIAARMVATGTTAFVYLDEPASADAAARALSGHDEFDVIVRSAQPDWSHLGQSRRVGELVLSAKPGYAIEDRGQWPWFIRFLAWTGPLLLDTSRSLKASHGYPPDTPGVHGVFYAWGDGIGKGRELERIDAIDIHPTVTHLLGIEPGKPVDGRVAGDFLEADD
ncbi:MAG: alkaline phosphatase family protein [Myxococcota bacterium]